jgi:diaminopimelate epimerase
VIQFWKYEGLGNDLVFFEGPASSVLPGDAAAWISAVCDRHLGVGADGIMCVEHTSESLDLARIHYFNADGSTAEMCGNGLRCAVLFLHHRGLAPLGEPFTVEMAGSGRRRCVMHEHSRIEVEVGRPTRGRGAEGEPDRIRVGVEGREVELIPLSVSNPHAVTFDRISRAEMEAIGPSIEHHRLFPDRVNVEFAHVARPGTIDLVVWERGCGFTRACGSGACAAATAAVWEGLCDPDTSIEVRLPGGTLHVRLDTERDVIWLEGPARLVFTGSLDPTDFGA